MRIRKLLRVGIINTLRLNICYFGVGGVLYPRIIASRHLKIIKLGGTVKAPDKIGCIQIGLNGIRIFDRKYERCTWSNSGEIVVNGRITLGQGVRISNAGRLVFGDKVCIQANSTIICYDSVEIQSEALVSWDTLIMDTDFHKMYYRVSNEERRQTNPPKKVVIGEHTWIGCRCLILKGSKIPSNSVIAAGSTMTKVFDDEYTVIGDNKILKESVEWEG